MSAAASSSGLTEADVSEFREVFNLVDVDRGGSISCDELGVLMETLGIKCSPEELKLMVEEIDENGNGLIDFDEFVQVMSRRVSSDYTMHDVKRAFQVGPWHRPLAHVCCMYVFRCLPVNMRSTGPLLLRT